MVTANSTSWKSFKKRFESLDKLPDLIAIQEHKLLSDDDTTEANAYLLKAGFASVWGKATTGPKNCPIGGVAIAATLKLGCKPCKVEAPQSRAIAANIQISEDTEFVFLSVYLHSGRGLKQPNLELLGAVAAIQEQHQRHLLAAGDWQNQPGVISKTDWLKRGNLSIAAPSRPTCIMKKSSSTIDYYVVSKPLATRLAHPTVVIQKQIATRRPVSNTVACRSSHVEQ